MPFHHDTVGKFYYRHWDCEAPRAAILLLHGFGEHSGHYHRFAASLVHSGFDVWALDHVGHGLTGGVSGRFDSIDQLSANADNLAGLVRHLHPGLPLVICGHSLGGITAANLALELKPQPIGIVLSGTPFDGLPVIDSEIELIMSQDPSYLDAIRYDAYKFDTGPAEASLWEAISAKTECLKTGLAQLRIPVLLINGQHDVFAPPESARAWAKTMPIATAIEIPGGYHDIPNDTSHRQVMSYVVAAIENWLSLATAKDAPVPAHPADS
ncbi:alpha/beta hydrolase [Pseudomonas fluorescens]|uniref:Monoacylglycerol lipase n=1 Tax=Pseudomonas fluorescens TaxID=294 RepID=A0A5E7E408_PSEFL|nr:alpha/beta fold hydrolase [Pseudomonas fluorescens]VVO19472.1 Monoacylglycerol lipase [Pseudomonas fluorescens]